MDFRTAKRHGHRKYRGDPCRDCGNETRYVTSKSCVDCARARVRKRRQAAKAARGDA
jgi:hypothetical protein